MKYFLNLKNLAPILILCCGLQGLSAADQVEVDANGVRINDDVEVQGTLEASLGLHVNTSESKLLWSSGNGVIEWQSNMYFRPTGKNALFVDANGDAKFFNDLSVDSNLSIAGSIIGRTDITTIHDSAHLGLERTVSATGKVYLGSAGDRDTADTYDEFRVYNGALTHDLRFTYYDATGWAISPSDGTNVNLTSDFSIANNLKVDGFGSIGSPAGAGSASYTDIFTKFLTQGDGAVANDIVIAGPAGSQTRLRFSTPNNRGQGEVGYDHATDRLSLNVNGLSHTYLTPNMLRTYKDLSVDGKVGIGTVSPSEKLEVMGNVKASSFIVGTQTLTVPDYVFADDYKLLSLDEVGKFIKEHKHLPNMPSEKEVKAGDLDIVQANMRNLEKIEELTLYTIDQHKQIKSQNEKIAQQTKLIEALSARLEALEAQQ